MRPQNRDLLLLSIFLTLSIFFEAYFWVPQMQGNTDKIKENLISPEVSLGLVNVTT